jgi:Flp pilus assembly protein TadD
MAKKLRNAARATHATRPGEPHEPQPAPLDKGQVLRGLASSLRESASHTGGFDKSQRHLLSAQRAERDGDLATAARELRLAAALAPERADLRAEHARVELALSASLASSYHEQAMYEQRPGKWGAAALSWAKAAEGRPDDPRAARCAAEALVQAKGDLHRARDLAQRAVDLAPSDIANLRALATVYIAAGLQLNARRVLQQAATLDPSDEMVENLLRDLDR